MNRIFCDICKAEIIFPKHSDESIDIHCDFADERWVLKIRTIKLNHFAADEADLCDKCFKDVFECAYKEIARQVGDL